MRTLNSSELLMCHMERGGARLYQDADDKLGVVEQQTGGDQLHVLCPCGGGAFLHHHSSGSSVGSEYGPLLGLPDQPSL